MAVRSTPDPARVVAALDTLRVGHRATAYGPGLKLAQTILEESELPTRELVLVSDFQRRGWTGEEGVRLVSEAVGMYCSTFTPKGARSRLSRS